MQLPVCMCRIEKIFYIFNFCWNLYSEKSAWMYKIICISTDAGFGELHDVPVSHSVAASDLGPTYVTLWPLSALWMCIIISHLCIYEHLSLLLLGDNIISVVIMIYQRLITGIRCYEHIIPRLRDTLHWLPISQCITFKIVLMMFECSRGRCPKYFGDVYTPVHTIAARSRLLSVDHGDLIIPHVWSTQFGSCSFRMCGPTIWNKLPQDLQSTDTREQFEHGFKRWLFECAYGSRHVW